VCSTSTRIHHHRPAHTWLLNLYTHICTNMKVHTPTITTQHTGGYCFCLNLCAHTCTPREHPPTNHDRSAHRWLMFLHFKPAHTQTHTHVSAPSCEQQEEHSPTTTTQCTGGRTINLHTHQAVPILLPELGSEQSPERTHFQTQWTQYHPFLDWVCEWEGGRGRQGEGGGGRGREG